MDANVIGRVLQSLKNQEINIAQAALLLIHEGCTADEAKRLLENLDSLTDKPQANEGLNDEQG